MPEIETANETELMTQVENVLVNVPERGEIEWAIEVKLKGVPCKVAGMLKRYWTRPWNRRNQVADVDDNTK